MHEPSAFQIQVRNGEDRALLHLRGELDFVTVGKLRSALGSLDGHITRVVIDLRDLRFIDSSGVKELLGFAMDDHPKRRVEFVRGSQAVDRIIEMLGLSAVLTFVGPEVLEGT